ncbi:MAG: hypothetical protein LBH00_12295 [Planctomycetaceae bacterium]|nr:hypothetical protein [Planctomycetaceae bacterium]
MHNEMLTNGEPPWLPIFTAGFLYACITAAFLTAAVIVYSPFRSHAEDNNNDGELPAAEPLILEGRFAQFSPDSKWAATESSENNKPIARIYDTATWKETAKIEKGFVRFAGFANYIRSRYPSFISVCSHLALVSPPY